jgi:DnaJ-class molecular chaperone
MSNLIDCPECDGDGTVEREVWVRQSATWHGDFGSEVQDCDNCNGKGQIEPLEEDE